MYSNAKYYVLDDFVQLDIYQNRSKSLYNSIGVIPRNSGIAKSLGFINQHDELVEAPLRGAISYTSDKNKQNN